MYATDYCVLYSIFASRDRRTRATGVGDGSRPGRVGKSDSRGVYLRNSLVGRYLSSVSVCFAGVVHLPAVGILAIVVYYELAECVLIARAVEYGFVIEARISTLSKLIAFV